MTRIAWCNHELQLAHGTLSTTHALVEAKQGAREDKESQAELTQKKIGLCQNAMAKAGRIVQGVSPEISTVQASKVIGLIHPACEPFVGMDAVADPAEVGGVFEPDFDTVAKAVKKALCALEDLMEQKKVRTRCLSFFVLNSLAS